MGKNKNSLKEKIEKYRERFGSNIFKSDSLCKHLMSILCNESINLKASTISNHCTSKNNIIIK